MEDLLIFIFQAFFEILGDLLGLISSMLLESPIYYYAKVDESNPWDFFGWLVFNLLVGLALGGLSLLVDDVIFIHSASARLTALFLAPPLSGFISYRLATYGGKSRGLPRHRFWWAFAFTFGFSVIRFTYCHRPH